MPRPVLKKGMKGNKGTELGNAIFLWRNFVGLQPAANVTVYDYGPLTVEKTKAFQKKHKLKENGEVDAATWAKYDSLQYGPPPPPGVSNAAKEAADKIAASQPPPSSAAQEAAAKIAAAPKKVAPAPKVPAIQSTPAAVVAAVPKNLTEVKEQVSKVIDATPLWMRIVGGAVSVGLTWLGIKKVISR